MDSKWQKVEEVYSLLLFKGVTRLKGDQKSLINMKEEENPLRRQLREKRQSVAYLTGDSR